MNKILNKDQLAAKRAAMESDSIKAAFYGFIRGVFREKTTFEKYIYLVLVLQLITILCSFISYCTGRVWMEQYIDVWAKNQSLVFWLSVSALALLEIVKVLAAMPVFLQIARLKRPSIFAIASLVAVFSFSAYISFHGGAKEVQDNSAPSLVKVDSIAKYYDDQIATKEIEKNEYLTSPAHQTKNGVVFIKTMTNHVKPLSEEITRLTKLRDSEVQSAKGENKTITSSTALFVTADANMMARIALGVDLIKLVISFFTAWFFVSCAKDYDIVNTETVTVTKDKTPPQPKKRDTVKRDKIKETVEKQEKELGSDTILNIVSSQLKNEFRQEKTKPRQIEWSVSNAAKETVKTVTEQHTVMHKGKPVTKAQVKNNIRKYKSRLSEAIEENKAASVVNNRQERLDYWNGRLFEFETAKAV